MSRIAAVFAAVAVLAACSSSTDEPPPCVENCVGAISGTVSGASVAGITISLTGTATASTTTGVNGAYSFTGLADGEYTLTPALAGFAFSPPSIMAAVRGATVADGNFSASATAPASGTWTAVVTGLPALWGVWAAGRDDVWVLGGGTGGLQGILHWNGSAWTSMPTALLLDAIWGSGPNDVWAVGQDSIGHGTILHWDGDAWSTSYAFPTTGTGLRAVWGTGPSDVWAARSGELIMHWDGTAWSSAGSSTFGLVNGVWPSGPSDVWAVGQTGLILHRNAEAWSDMSTISTTYLWDTWGSSANDVWAVGNHSASGDGIVMRWNGSAWSSVTMGTNPFYAVRGTGSGDVWLAGAGNTVHHWDGASWSSFPTDPDVHSVWDVWPISANDAWAVAWKATPPSYGLILHYE